MKKTLHNIVRTLKTTLTTPLEFRVDNVEESEQSRIALLLKEGYKRSNLPESRYAIFERGHDYLVFDKATSKIASEYIHSRLYEGRYKNAVRKN